MGRLYINGVELDTPKDFKFARTKQVNTIGRLDNRQSNYTQSIKIPKTKNNVKVLDYLGTLGNSSNVPYSINNVRYINDAGVDEIFDGVAIVRKTDSSYNLTLYDGYISFAKAIENKVLTDVGLSELNHLKNIDTVKDTWGELNLPYKYIVADYNGKMTVNARLNIDYLIPSVNVKYLWNKVHEYAGYTYEGSVFDDAFFNSLWITYPKTIGDGTQQTLEQFTNVWTQELRYYNPSDDINSQLKRSFSLTGHFGGLPNPNSTTTAYLSGRSWQILNTLNSENRYIDDLYFDVLQTALFKITVSGKINRLNPSLSGGAVVVNTYTQGVETLLFEEVTDVGDFNYGESFEHVLYKQMDSGTVFDVSTAYAGLINISQNATGSVNVKIEVVTGNTVDFQEAFINFKIQDFINEVLWRFSLTPFKDKYENNIKYLTTTEWLQTEERVDWSSSKNKYVRQLDEVYILPNYAQRNYMRYKYNDNNFEHNDGYLRIENRNIKSETDIIKSNLFSPEPLKTAILSDTYNVYKFWEKEPKENGEIEYKDLQNRFYIMESQRVTSSLNITSEISGEEQTVTTYDRESFENLSFDKIIQNNYRPIYSILNGARVITAEIFLNDNDISNLDFSKLYYIREQGSYFILDKIPNYVKKGVYKCSLVEVDLLVTDPDDITETPTETPTITLTSSLQVPNELQGTYVYGFSNVYYFNNYIPIDGVYIEFKQLDDLGNETGVVYTSPLDEVSSSFVYSLGIVLNDTTCGTFTAQVIDPNQNISSNIETVLVPCPVVEAEPDIYFFVANGTAPSASPITRLAQYEWKNFTPTTASLEIQQIDILLGTDIGSPTTVNLTELTPDTIHTTNLTFNGGSTWYRVTITTDTETLQVQFYIL